MTLDFLDFLKLIAEGHDVVFRDAYDDKKIDRLVRRDKFFYLDGYFNDSGFVTFKVGDKCRCSWPSAMGTFEFQYEVYFP